MSKLPTGTTLDAIVFGLLGLLAKIEVSRWLQIYLLHLILFTDQVLAVTMCYLRSVCGL